MPPRVLLCKALIWAKASKVDGSSTSYNLLTGSYDWRCQAGRQHRPHKFDSFKANEYQIGVDVPLASNLILSGGYANSS